MKEAHPLTALIPERATQGDLELSIAQDGPREPVVLYEKKVIEGRVRQRACLAIGIQPQFREWVLMAEGAPLDWMVKKHISDHPQTELELIRLVVTLLPEYREMKGATHRLLYEATGLSWNKIRVLDWLEQAGKIKQVLSGELGVLEAGREFGFVQEKRKLSAPSFSLGSGDPFDEATQPLRKYLSAWEKNGFEFKHINPREAARRLKVIDGLTDSLSLARVDIERRSHAATLSAPPERKERRDG